jgi:hypothetical protein
MAAGRRCIDRELAWILRDMSRRPVACLDGGEGEERERASFEGVAELQRPNMLANVALFGHVWYRYQNLSELW